MAHFTYETSQYAVILNDQIQSRHTSMVLAEKAAKKLIGSHIENFKDFCERKLAPYRTKEIT